MKKRVLIVLVVVLALALLPGSAGADGCTVTVSAPNSIQAAVDAASSGDVVCLSGTFIQQVVFGPEDSGITLKGNSAVLDGTGLVGDAITLAAGVSGVTIEGLEIRNYTASSTGVGNAIQAWNSGTSDITVRNNHMHDNSWNAILVGNEGTGLHERWFIKDNLIEDNGAYSLEVTNCQECVVHDNTVKGADVGILVQARNTIPDSGMFTVQDVHVASNNVSGASMVGIYVLGMASGPTPPFPPITGAWSTLEDVMLLRNEVSDSGSGAWIYGYLGGNVYNAKAVRNSLDCSMGGSVGLGIFGNSSNSKAIHNTLNTHDNCGSSFNDGGTATHIPQGPK